MNTHVRAALIGLAVTVAMLLLGDLVIQLRNNATADFDRSSAMWSFGFEALIGVVACYGVLAGRRDRLAAAVPAVLLVWPILGSVLPLVPSPPAWIPLLGGLPDRNPAITLLAVGVLAAAALLPKRVG